MCCAVLCCAVLCCVVSGDVSDDSFLVSLFFFLIMYNMYDEIIKIIMVQHNTKCRHCSMLDSLGDLLVRGLVE